MALFSWKNISSTRLLASAGAIAGYIASNVVGITGIAAIVVGAIVILLVGWVGKEAGTMNELNGLGTGVGFGFMIAGIDDLSGGVAMNAMIAAIKKAGGV